MRNISNTSQIDSPSLSPKKTLFIMVTVVGCIAILWPKVFYPMMFGGGAAKQNLMKDHRSGTDKSTISTCCEVVLDRDTFLNMSLAVGDKTYRKQINFLTGEISLRQERPPHLRPDTIHPAMRERGRAIPETPTVPIIERARTPPSPPRVVEGRPGPIPGMRPPMGAGSVHQAQPKTSSMGFIMPLYTVGIVAFFIYTIMKILFKKPVPNAPYGASRADPAFHKEVFGHEKSCWKRSDDCSGHKLGLLDAADEQLKIRENSTNLSKESSGNSQQQNANILNGHAKPIQSSDPSNNLTDVHNKIDRKNESNTELDQNIEKVERKKIDDNVERSVVSTVDDEKIEPQPIYLEGALPHESQILVTDSETHTEKIVDEEFDGTLDEPAVVLSSKMTLSLINLNSDNEDENKNESNDKDSPLGEDIEIINGDENEVKKQTKE